MPMMAPPLFQWHADSRASMTDAGGNIFDMFGDGGAGSAGALDAMLEVLPEDVDAPFGMGVGSNNSTTGAGAGAGTGSGEHHIGYSNAQPIDVANHQNGEIAQLWDFNVDEFMMTPSGSSDSATISAPNSFNSEQHASVPGNWGPLLGAAFPADLAPQPLFQAPPALPADLPLFRPTLPTRRSSSQLSKALADDGAVPLASAATANSVRKSSVTRPLSSSSLSSYRQNSLSELPKKPQVQCFNCKTFKTPLWRRDAQGNTMCNACGLFQKLHGTMRPLSLKSDVIRKRNTKKRGKKTDTKDTTAKNAAPAGAPPSTTAASTTATSDRDVPLPATPTISTSKTNSSTNLSVNGTFTTSNTQLNSNVLMNHNRRMLPSAGVSKKSRRSSSSSSASNSSNRSSSSRSMVPILPKPSPGATASSTSRSQSQVTSFPSSAGNSAASSPRYSNSPRPASATSPLPTSNGNQLSSSGGRPGVTIVRRKSSRQTMNSSSFMAASLQQHQQHMNFQSSNPVGSSSSTISAHSVSWNSNGISAPSPNSGRSPRSPFDLFSSSQEPHSRPASRKQHTSLLSQQLQQATASPQYPQSPSQFQTFPSNGNSTSATPQPVSIKRSPITASPRNSYMDSIQQQRGVPSENSVRRTTSLRSEANNSVSGITTNAQNSHKHKEGFMEDLEWLKFGL